MVLAIEHEGGGDVLAGRSAGAAARLQLDGSVDDLPQWQGIDAACAVQVGGSPKSLGSRPVNFAGWVNAWISASFRIETWV